ncbi:MAG TPA: glycerol-3-phosphate dehydrogenase/oxidase [Gemmatimonadales bacterium]
MTEAPFSAATRAARLAALPSEPLDLLVIGGGITGAGIARDAAMRGIRTALIDAGDFAWGTSSRSSRLIHGGLRYLEHGWLRLVFEASRERRTLLRIAPHLVRPRAFVFPAFEGTRLKRWEISAGVWLYDILSLFRNVHAHRLLSRRGVLKREPALRERGLTGGAVYWDAQTDDARLTLATLRSAHQHGAACLSYVRATSLEKADGRVRGAELEDAFTGERFRVHAHVVVNATGPWTDTLRKLDRPDAPPLLRPTKGAHIAVPQKRIGNAGAVTLLSPIDGRVMFILPWGDVTIVGTTDTDDKAGPDDVSATADDVVYLIRSANAIFPDARLGIEDVIAAWAGLRPLLRDDGAGHASDVPREHRLEESPSGLVTIAGGKLTTYRAMAAQVVNLVVRKLRALDRRTLPTHAASALEALPGGEIADIDALIGQMKVEGLDDETATYLVGAYGTEATAVAKLMADDPAMAQRLIDGAPWRAAEVIHQARREMALTVSDVLIRRTHIYHRKPVEGAQAAPLVAALLQRELHWDDARRDASVRAYRAEVDRMRAAFTPASV